MEEKSKSELMYFLEVHCKRSNKLGDAVGDVVKGKLRNVIIKDYALPEVIKWINTVIDAKREEFPRCNGGRLAIFEYEEVYHAHPCKRGFIQFYAKDNADSADVTVGFTPCEELWF